MVYGKDCPAFRRGDGFILSVSGVPSSSHAIVPFLVRTGQGFAPFSTFGHNITRPTVRSVPTPLSNDYPPPFRAWQQRVSCPPLACLSVLNFRSRTDSGVACDACERVYYFCLMWVSALK